MKNVEISAVVVIGEEDVLAVVPTLGDMMGGFGSNEPGTAGHAG